VLIALDYDDTYTKDPEFWETVIRYAYTKNHTVICVTMRHQHEGEELFHSIGKLCRIIFTGRIAKQCYLSEMEIYPDIWIDDRPEWILRDAR